MDTAERLLTFQMSNKVVLGRGAVSELPALVRRLQGSRVFVITDEGIVRAGVADRVLQSLKSAGVEHKLCSKAKPDPSIANVYECLEPAKEFKCDLLIGLGGGSSIDMAKMASVLLTNRGEVGDYFGTDNIPEPGLKKIAIPTTSGSGSEATPIAVLSDTENQVKKGIVSEHLYPDVALIDPELIATLPAHITAFTGVDALTHAVEAYTNRYAQPFVDTFALRAIHLIGTYLPRAVENGNDLEARYFMSMASLYGGMCLGSVNTAAVHALAYPLGGMFDIPHGVANSLLLPYVMTFNMPSSPEKFAEIAIALGDGSDTASHEELAQRSAQRVASLCSRVGIVSNMRELNIPQNAIEPMAEAAMNVTRLLGNNPREVTRADARRIYQEAYTGGTNE